MSPKDKDIPRSFGAHFKLEEIKVSANIDPELGINRIPGQGDLFNPLQDVHPPIDSNQQ